MPSEFDDIFLTALPNYCNPRTQYAKALLQIRQYVDAKHGTQYLLEFSKCSDERRGIMHNIDVIMGVRNPQEFGLLRKTKCPRCVSTKEAALPNTIFTHTKTLFARWLREHKAEPFRAERVARIVCIASINKPAPLPFLYLLEEMRREEEAIARSGPGDGEGKTTEGGEEEEEEMDFDLEYHEFKKWEAKTRMVLRGIRGSRGEDKDESMPEAESGKEVKAEVDEKPDWLTEEFRRDAAAAWAVLEKALNEDTSNL